jgi:quercetin dioxygenase-like cupin family protein
MIMWEQVIIIAEGETTYIIMWEQVILVAEGETT